MIDPGIQRFVELLNRRGFKTTDSGDGQAKSDLIAEGLAEPTPHVYISVVPSLILSETRRLMDVLRQVVRPEYLGSHRLDTHLGQLTPNVTVEGIYYPVEDIGVIAVHGIRDENLVHI